MAQYELKEDNPKNLTESINGWLSNKELINCIPADFDIQSLMSLDCTNYEIIGSPSFTTLNGDQNQIIIKVEIERHDLTNTWDQQIKRFEGSLVLQKDINANRLNLTTTYTSQETKDVIQSIS